MDIEIVYDTPDLEPGSKLNQLIKCIIDFLSLKQNDDSLKIKKNYSSHDFKFIVDNLEEYYYEKISYLTKLSPERHQILWFLSLEALATPLLKFKSFYYENLLNDSNINRNELHNTNETLAAIFNKLERLSSIFRDITCKFLLEDSLSIVKFLSPGTYSTFLKDKLFNYIITCFKLLTIDEEEDMLYRNDNGPTLQCVAKLVFKYYEHVDYLEDLAKQELMNDAFPTLTEFIRTVYIMGESELLIPFLSSRGEFSPIINPKTPLNIIQTAAIDFIYLINYYKFTAFNLISLSISNKDIIEDKYNIQSDIYFKVLLNFPNLNSSVYERFEIHNNQSENLLDSSQLQEVQANDVEFSSVSLLERQEISLLFILNYLLQLTDLRNLVEPEKYYKSELNFLIRSLSTSISQDIHISASRSGSLHSSTAPSYSQLNILESLKQQKQNSNIKFESLSSIILHGTYKEKLNAIIHFCKKLNQKSLNIPSIIESFNLDDNSENDFQHLVSMVDTEKYPGKLEYARTIGKIIRLLKLIGIKHLVNTSLINNVPESYLNQIFCSRELLSNSTRVKDLIRFTERKEYNSQETIIKFEKLSDHRYVNLDTLIKGQIECFKTTKDLEKLAEHLK